MADNSDQAASDSVSRELIEELVNTAYDRLQAGEKRLGLPEGTLQDLKNEPDYAMVIKIIATVEPVINELIELGLTQPHGGLGGRTTKSMFGDLSRLLTDHRVNLNGRPSKLDMAESLQMISLEDRKYIEVMTQIRNRYAHNIRNVAREIKDFCNEFSKSDAKFNEKLLRVNVPSIEFPNDALKFLVVISFSKFLENVEQAHSSLASDVNDLLNSI